MHKWPISCQEHKCAQVQGAYDLWFQVHAIAGLQEAAEYYMVNLFKGANICGIHTKCVIKMPINSRLACQIFQEQPLLFCFFCFLCNLYMGVDEKFWLHGDRDSKVVTV